MKTSLIFLACLLAVAVAQRGGGRPGGPGGRPGPGRRPLLAKCSDGSRPTCSDGTLPKRPRRGESPCRDDGGPPLTCPDGNPPLRDGESVTVSGGPGGRPGGPPEVTCSDDSRPTCSDGTEPQRPKRGEGPCPDGGIPLTCPDGNPPVDRDGDPFCAKEERRCCDGTVLEGLGRRPRCEDGEKPVCSDAQCIIAREEET